MYLLDTDHIIVLQRRTQPDASRLLQRIAQHPASAFFFSIVSFHEQVLGANAYISRARTFQDIVQGYELFEQIRKDYGIAQVAPFDRAAALEFEALRTQRVRIATMDLRIASIARVRQWVVLTRNRTDFSRVPGLQSEDWTA